MRDTIKLHPALRLILEAEIKLGNEIESAEEFSDGAIHYLVFLKQPYKEDHAEKQESHEEVEFILLDDKDSVTMAEGFGAETHWLVAPPAGSGRKQVAESLLLLSVSLLLALTSVLFAYYREDWLSRLFGVFMGLVLLFGVWLAWVQLQTHLRIVRRVSWRRQTLSLLAELLNSREQTHSESIG